MMHGPLVEFLRKSQWRVPLEERLIGSVRERLAVMSDQELEKAFDNVMGPPIDYSVDMCLDLLFHYFIASWLGVFEGFRCPKDARVYEVAAGSTTSVLDALGLYSGGQAGYVTSNLNRRLSEAFLSRTAEYCMDIRVVGDDSVNIGNAYGPGSFGLIAFHHALNDIIWNAVGTGLGLDTVNGDWFANAPLMAKESSRLYREGRLEAVVHDGFMELIRACHGVLADGGIMAFHNCMFASDLARGFDWDLYHGLIGLADGWIGESGLGLGTVRLDGYDPQWWLFLVKD